MLNQILKRADEKLIKLAKALELPFSAAAAASGVPAVGGAGASTAQAISPKLNTPLKDSSLWEEMENNNKLTRALDKSVDTVANKITAKQTGKVMDKARAQALKFPASLGKTLVRNLDRMRATGRITNSDPSRPGFVIPELVTQGTPGSAAAAAAGIDSSLLIGNRGIMGPYSSATFMRDNKDMAPLGPRINFGGMPQLGIDAYQKDAPGILLHELGETTYPSRLFKSPMGIGGVPTPTTPVWGSHGGPNAILSEIAYANKNGKETADRFSDMRNGTLEINPIRRAYRSATGRTKEFNYGDPLPSNLGAFASALEKEYAPLMHVAPGVSPTADRAVALNDLLGEIASTMHQNTPFDGIPGVENSTYAAGRRASGARVDLIRNQEIRKKMIDEIQNPPPSPAPSKPDLDPLFMKIPGLFGAER
jgi:hypothetical protein